jgi:serine/threonine protein kinase
MSTSGFYKAFFSCVTSTSTVISTVTDSKLTNQHQDPSRPDIGLDMFIFQSVLGQGGFGKVLCGVFIHTDVWYAVKCVPKARVLGMRTGADMLFNELHALRKLPRHPFISGIQYAFQDM